MTIIDVDGDNVVGADPLERRTIDHTVPDAARLHEDRCGAVLKEMTIIGRQSIDHSTLHNRGSEITELGEREAPADRGIAGFEGKHRV